MLQLILSSILTSGILIAKQDTVVLSETQPKNMGKYEGPCGKLATPKALESLFQRGKKKSVQDIKQLAGTKNKTESIFNDSSMLQFQGRMITIHKGTHGYRACMDDMGPSKCKLPSKNKYIDASIGFEVAECYLVHYVSGELSIRIELCPNETQYSWIRKGAKQKTYFQRTEIHAQTGVRVAERHGERPLTEKDIKATEAWGINTNEIPYEFRNKEGFFCYYSE